MKYPKQGTDVPDRGKYYFIKLINSICAKKSYVLKHFKNYFYTKDPDLILSAGQNPFSYVSALKDETKTNYYLFSFNVKVLNFFTGVRFHGMLNQL